MNDYIVEEVRKAGELLAEKANYDIHIFFENLRKNSLVSRVIDLSQDKEKENQTVSYPGAIPHA